MKNTIYARFVLAMVISIGCCTLESCAALEKASKPALQFLVDSVLETLDPELDHLHESLANIKRLKGNEQASHGELKAAHEELWQTTRALVHKIRSTSSEPSEVLDQIINSLGSQALRLLFADTLTELDRHHEFDPRNA